MAPAPATTGAREGEAAAKAAAEEEEHEEDEEDEEHEEEEEEAPSHLPLAPPSELCDTSTTVDPSYIIHLIRQLLPKEVEKQDNGDSATHQEFQQQETNGVPADGHTKLSEINDPWEDSGCILWDLSASKTHAEFMVDNLLLEVLLASLHVSKSLRVMEISLGIIGNLACHDDLSSTIVSKNGLVETVVQQLFLDDSTCLSETFRLLASGLQGNKFAFWAEALLPDQILIRILWIVGNTLNPVLLEKSIDFLLAIISNQGVSNILLQPLIKLGLPNLVASLLAGELTKLRDENKLERSSNLDQVLGLVESLSATDNYSQVIISNEELLPLVCGLVKLPDKIEVANSCVSATVIIANILIDEQHLAFEFSQDFAFLRGLLDILPFLSDDPQARNAFWCIMAGILGQVQENDISISTLQQFASLFVDKSHLIEEDIKSHPMEDLAGSPNIIPDGHKSYATATSLRRIACILEKWIFEKPAFSEEDIAGADDSKLHRLLHYCRKYVRLK